jgi:methylthioribose-1-phosphate isomerase
MGRGGVITWEAEISQVSCAGGECAALGFGTRAGPARSRISNGQTQQFVRNRTRGKNKNGQQFVRNRTSV